MNSFLKTNSQWLGLTGLGLAIVIMAFLFRPHTPGYQVNIHDALILINDPSKRVEIKDMAGKQFIDIRPSDLYAQGHIQNAINLPLRQLLDGESISTLKQFLAGGKDVVLYGSDELQATAPWLLLQQLGYKNVFLLKGGMSATGELKGTDSSSAEAMLQEIKALKVKPIEKSTPETSIEKKKADTVIPVRKATSAGGGC
jgi:rhodanese-related sulfurtransferase